jgi:hypothetical protein
MRVTNNLLATSSRACDLALLSFSCQHSDLSAVATTQLQRPYDALENAALPDFGDQVGFSVEPPLPLQLPRPCESGSKAPIPSFFSPSQRSAEPPYMPEMSPDSRIDSRTVRDCGDNLGW